MLYVIEQCNFGLPAKVCQQKSASKSWFIVPAASGVALPNFQTLQTQSQRAFQGLVIVRIFTQQTLSADRRAGV